MFLTLRWWRDHARARAAPGVQATALGVPSAVVSIGLPQGVLDPTRAAAIIAAALVTIAVSTAGDALLVRRETRDPPVGPIAS